MKCLYKENQNMDARNRGMTGKETYLMWMDWKNQYC